MNSTTRKRLSTAIQSMERKGAEKSILVAPRGNGCVELDLVLLVTQQRMRARSATAFACPRFLDSSASLHVSASAAPRLEQFARWQLGHAPGG